MESESNEEPKQIIPGYASIKEFIQDGFKILIEATRNGNALPQERNWDFYNAHKSFRNLLNQEGINILHLINNIIREQGISGSFSSRDIDEKIEVIVEANDTILERAAINLDELNGISKNPELPVQIQAVSAILPISGAWNKIDNVSCTVSSFESTNKNATGFNPNSIRLITGNNIQRPQKFFKDRIENSNKYPWEPRIVEKPNSLKPLALYLEEGANGLETFCHPYEFELERFEPPADLLKSIKPVKPKPLLNTPLRMVETAKDLEELVEDLRKYTEIAVDLEHHSYRSFQGITCLMQISTADTDYLVDTLVLRDKLCILNEIFTKPTILKIFHGSDHDIEWLQRDLSLYVVNMFDTFQAAKQIGYEQRSLAFLLKKFCKVDANKHFQLADWRIRPLPDELKLYAREDTHYLTYIYHMMRNELIELGNKGTHILKSVIQQSTELCKKRYFKPILQDDSHMDLYRRCKKLFDNKQLYALKELYQWRDNMARTEDESTGYILPNHMLLQIAEILPREMQGVLACCNPIPPLVRANLLEIHKMVLKAREQSLVKPILSEEVRSRGSTQTATKMNVDNVLNCPHDLSNSKEFRDDLPTLLGNFLQQKNCDKNENSKQSLTKILPAVIENKKPVVDIFERIEKESNQNTEVARKVQKLKFLGPFERYKLVKPFIQAEADKEAILEKEKVLEVEKQGSEVKVVEERNTECITDADRIAKIHEHFLQVERIAPQIMPPKHMKKQENYDTIPLRQMTGCKRKRSPSHHEEEHIGEEVSMMDKICNNVYSVAPGSNLNNVTENLTKSQRQKRNKKLKKLQDQLETGGNNQTSQPAKAKKKNHRKPFHTTEGLETHTQKIIAATSLTEEKQILKRNEHFVRPKQNRKLAEKQRLNQELHSNQQQFDRNSQQHNQPAVNKQNRQQRNRNQFKNQDKQQYSHQNTEQRSQQESNAKERNGRPQKRPNTQHNQPSASQPNTNLPQHSNQQNTRKRHWGNSDSQEFQAYDYSAVDFNQFQGGASSAHGGKKVKSNFKAKNKGKGRGKGIGKSNNKSAIFDLGRMGGRGGGR